MEITTFYFLGQKRFRCPDCDFDSHEKQQIVEHWMVVHKTQEAPNYIENMVLYNERDEPIEKERKINLPSWMREL